VAFKVQIVNIENNVNNILLTDDLTIEILKVRYNWVLNASIKDAVLGLDENGLVWYMGEWLCGEWEDGTWYSGIFHSGIWKKGRWYSYLLDKPMILSKRFVVLEEDKMYSQFLNGSWLSGTWYNGIFGNDTDISGKTTTQITVGDIGCPYWYTGTWYKGLFKNSVWKNGVFFNGSFTKSYWLDGKFYNGYFDKHEWWGGSFYGGDFIRGTWKSGTLNQLNSNIAARFGVCTGTTSDGTLTTWESGSFEKGQFMSGLYRDVSGNTVTSLCHHTTHWLDGSFNNGVWWGGHFEKGIFNYGDWYGGVFNTSIEDAFTQYTIWKNGTWHDGLWLNGTFKSGTFLSGMWMNGIFENGFLVSLFTSIMTIDLKTNVIPSVLPPPPPPPSYTAPTVTTNSITSINYNTAVGGGNVTSDGGLTTTRGICYSSETLIPTITDTIITDTSTGTGSYSCNIAGLIAGTEYYVRAWATNSIGTSYGAVETFTTLSAPTGLPVVKTASATLITSLSADLWGAINSDGGSGILHYGFYISVNANPLSSPNASDDKGAIGSSIPPIWGFDTLVKPLSSGTTYYFLAYAENVNGVTYGNIESFTTL